MSNLIDCLFGKHLPFGQAAVSFAYDPEYGTFREMKNIKYQWNYYKQYATKQHPYNVNDLIKYSDLYNQTTTCRDAMGHLLLDWNHDGEIDVQDYYKTESPLYAFHEHNGVGSDCRKTTDPFMNFWMDDNWIGRIMAESYGEKVPEGLTDITDFNRWDPISNNVTNYKFYKSNLTDQLALDGLGYLAWTTPRVGNAIKKWKILLNNSGASYESEIKSYLYPNITENYHLGLFLIFTSRLFIILAESEYDKIHLPYNALGQVGEACVVLLQHIVSLRNAILTNQQKQEKDTTTLFGGWTTAIPPKESLINTESTTINVLGLSAHSKWRLEAGFSPLEYDITANYFLRPYHVVSAVLGETKENTVIAGLNLNTFWSEGDEPLDLYLYVRIPTLTYTKRPFNRSDNIKVLSVLYNEDEPKIQIETNACLKPNNEWVRIKIGTFTSNYLQIYWDGEINMDLAFIDLI